MGHGPQNTQRVTKAADRVERLRLAAFQLAADAWAVTDVEPETQAEAAQAVTWLGEYLDAQTGSKHQALLGQLDNADMLSSDPLQVLSELVQNADDAKASEVRFRLDAGQLLVAHDGRDVRLRDLQFLALPGLSGKREDPLATGRFGIGLSTIRSLTNAWEIHQGPFRVQFEGSTIRTAATLDPAGLTDGPDWTVFRIPLTKFAITSRDLDSWFASWDNAALLFLRTVRVVRVAAGGEVIRELSLKVQSCGVLSTVIGSHETQVNITRVEFPDGAVWHLFQTEVPTPEGLSRRHKSTADTMPLGVGLPAAPIARGVVHSGLPVSDIPVMGRVNALFETLTNRQDFIGGQWNAVMGRIVAQLWAAAVKHVLQQVDARAWHIVPIRVEIQRTSGGLPDELSAHMLELGRTTVAAQLRLRGPRRMRYRLADLAIEEEALTGVVPDDDIAAVANLPVLFPAAARDTPGRWRRVMSDWRHAGHVGVREEVTVTDALMLLERDGYPIADVLRLAARAVERHLSPALARTRCLVAADGTRHAPPEKGQLAMVFSAPPPEAKLTDELPDALGFGITLHDAYYADSGEAGTVRSWLRGLGCLVDPGDARALLNRVAEFGRAGGELPDPPGNDAALRALLAAMRQVDDRHRRRVGADIGRTLRLRATRHTVAGDTVECLSAPSQAYLPAPLDSRKRSFFEAAGGTAGLPWISAGYRKTLRMRGGDQGLTIGAFLQLLGVADTPRLQAVTGSIIKHYARDSRSGYPAAGLLSPVDRRSELVTTGASHTLDDQISPHLDAVARSIATDPDGVRRRRRALALMETLRRASLLTGSASRVQSATADRGWVSKARTWPLWGWRLREIAWVDDMHGKAARPDHLHRKTKAALVLYGAEDPGYLHPDFESFAVRHADSIRLLGIEGEPTPARLVQRLRDLKRRSARGTITDQIRAEAHVVYQVMAQSAAASDGAPPVSLPSREQLILSDQGWRTASEVYRGRSFLAGYRPFAPGGDELEGLWEALGLRTPSADDVIEVLKTIASKERVPESSDQAVVLEGLRYLDTVLSAAEPGEIDLGMRNRLRSIPVWTAAGWSRRQPRYLAASRDLARRLSPSLTVWEPGGQLDLSTETLRLLSVARIDLSQATAVAARPLAVDADLTDRFQRTIVRFQDEIARFEPQAADTFTGWTWLAGLAVHVTPGLRVTFPIAPDGITIPVGAHIDQAEGILRIDSADGMRTAVGDAIAAYFAVGGEHVAMRWTRVWDHEDEQDAYVSAPLVTSHQRDLLAQQTLTEQLGQRAHTAPQVPVSAPVDAPLTGPAPTPSPAAPPFLPVPLAPARRLVDPAMLDLESPLVQIYSSAGSGGSAPARHVGVGHLPEPRAGGAAPRQHLGHRTYTDLERETLALELLRAALRQRGLTLHDHRAQPGLGADAVDSAGDFYEIKAHAGPEADSESITLSQLQRAYRQGRSFHLVIAANLEQGNGAPTLRIIKDPLRHLAVEVQDSIRLQGLLRRDLEAEEFIFPQRPSLVHDSAG
jgi:hypothetical protein